jgi:hypothetical protein
MRAADIMRNWLEKSREPAQLVIDQYGEPDDATRPLPFRCAPSNLLGSGTRSEGQAACPPATWYA